MSSWDSLGPTFWENADPVPRNVKNVQCDQQLHGEWFGGAYSITAEADLSFNTLQTPETSFYGSIKYIYNLPDKDSDDYGKLFAQPEPGFPWNAASHKDIVRKQDHVKYLFANRRTWTYPDRLQIDDEKDYGGESSAWKGWMDTFEFGHEGALDKPKYE